MADSVVKIDKELEKKIEGLIKKNKFLYSSKKQVVNLAVIEFLNSRTPDSGHYKKSGDFLSKEKLNTNKKKRVKNGG